MAANSTAVHDLRDRRLYIATRLAGQLADEIEDLERQILSTGLRDRVEFISRLAAVRLDELGELEESP